MVTTAVQSEEPRLSTKEKARRLAEKVEPFDWDKYRTTHTPGFESEEEMEAFIADIYTDRKRNPA